MHYDELHIPLKVTVVEGFANDETQAVTTSLTLHIIEPVPANTLLGGKVTLILPPTGIEDCTVKFIKYCVGLITYGEFV